MAFFTRIRIARWGLILAILGGLTLAANARTVRGDGAAGFALHFDGAHDMVELLRTNDIFPDSWRETKTVSLWVKPDGVGTCSTVIQNGNPVVIVSPGTCDNIFGDFARWWGISQGPTQYWVWMACCDQPRLPGEQLCPSVNGTPNKNTIKSIAFNYTIGEWTHIAMVHEDNTLTAYKNGTPVGSFSCFSTAQPPAQPVLYFGGMIRADNQNQNHAIWGFGGQIDELRLYSVGLTQQQILDTLQVELVGNEPGLVAYYRMSDGSGMTVSDDSSNNFTGTLMDGTINVPGDGTPPQWVASGAFDTPPVVDRYIFLPMVSR